MQGFADDLYHINPIRKPTILHEATAGAGSLPTTVKVEETTRAREQVSAAILSCSALRIAELILLAALANFSWSASHHIRTALAVARIQSGLAQETLLSPPAADALTKAASALAFRSCVTLQPPLAGARV